jgi:hypothetical protein
LIGYYNVATVRNRERNFDLLLLFILLLFVIGGTSVFWFFKVSLNKSLDSILKKSVSRNLETATFVLSQNIDPGFIRAHRDGLKTHFFIETEKMIENLLESDYFTNIFITDTSGLTIYSTEKSEKKGNPNTYILFDPFAYDFSKAGNIISSD